MIIPGVDYVTSSAFAQTDTNVSVAVGTSVPGCEETNECYIPYEVTVDAGGEVTWTNDDSAAHTVTAGNAADGLSGEFDSGLFMTGATFTHKFESVGTYDYFCMVHPWMVGVVMVQEAGAEEEKEVHEEEKEVHEEEEEVHEEESIENEMMKMETKMVGNVDVTMSPPLEGSEDASVTIIEFGDFQCPKCEQWFQNEKSAIKSDYIDTGKANLYFVDFPFLGEDSDIAANASYCANDQGKYWEYHSHLYTNQGGINEGWANSDALKQFAVDLGLDTDEFNSCLDSNKYADRVSYNKQVGANHGVEGTPVFVIINSDGTSEQIDGPQPSAIFANVIDGMLDEPIEEAMDETMEEITESTTEVSEEITESTTEVSEEITESTTEVSEEITESTTEVSEEITESTTEGIKVNEDGGGCLIATAAYGTELAPQVQFLREIRDNTVMSTASGASFMTGFNQLYYSFSPTIADMERENPVFQEMVRAFITPMISTLSIMTLAEDGSEIEVLGLGISVIALNLGMYVATPAVVGFAINKKIKSRK